MGHEQKRSAKDAIDGDNLSFRFSLVLDSPRFSLGSTFAMS